MRDSVSTADFVLRLYGDAPEQAWERKPDSSLIGCVKMGILVLSRRGCVCITHSDRLRPQSCWPRFLVGHVVNPLPWEMRSRESPPLFPQGLVQSLGECLEDCVWTRVLS